MYKLLSVAPVLLLIWGASFLSPMRHVHAAPTTPNLQSETGTLIGSIEDDFQNRKSRERYFIESIRDGQVTHTELDFDGRMSLPLGSKVKVIGSKTSSGVLSVSPQNNIGSVQVISQGPQRNDAITGPKKVIVLLVNFSDLKVTDPTSSEVDSIFDSQLTPYMTEMSYGKATFSYDVIPDWVTMPIVASCDPFEILPEAVSAAGPVVNFDDYQYVLVLFPNTNCNYGGIAFYPPGLWINTEEGPKAFAASLIPSDYAIPWGKTVGAHELGHNLGLVHANGLECGEVSLGPTCLNRIDLSSVEYGDWFDIMGGGDYVYSSHYGAYYKEFLGWLSNANTRVVTQTGRYSVSALETSPNGIVELKIPIEGTNYYYSVENRTNTGFDGNLPDNAVSGALIKIVPNSLEYTIVPFNTYILDGTPNSQPSNDFNDGGFMIGTAFEDREHNIRIAPVSKSNGVLLVDVNFGLEKDTTGVFRPSDGSLYLKNQNATGFADLQINYGLPGDNAVAADWDGDGDATIGIYRSGTFYLRNANTAGFAQMVFPFGQPDDQPIAGDWNGDGVDTIGVYRSSTGQFFLRNENSEGQADVSFFLGNVGDVGISGDWDGDGIDTTGVFRPSNGTIFLKNNNSTGFADTALNYGLPGDTPVTGDWNNDGVDTIGVYLNGTFYLRNSNTIGFPEIIFRLGNPGDMPIAGNWDGLP